MLKFSRVPFYTLLVVVLAFSLRFIGWPDTYQYFAHHRDGIFSGELWRLWTGHLLHKMMEHLFRDSAVYLLFGSLAEHRLGRLYLPFLLGSALAFSLIYLVFQPQSAWYYGLSGLVSVWCGYLALREMAGAWKRGNRWLLVVMGAVAFTFIVKVVWESLFGSFLYRDIKVSVPAHTIGGAIGLLAWGIEKYLLRHEVSDPFPKPHRWIAAVSGAAWILFVVFWKS